MNIKFKDKDNDQLLFSGVSRKIKETADRAGIIAIFDKRGFFTSNS